MNLGQSNLCHTGIGLRDAGRPLEVRIGAPGETALVLMAMRVGRYGGWVDRTTAASFLDRLHRAQGDFYAGGSDADLRTLLATASSGTFQE